MAKRGGKSSAHPGFKGAARAIEQREGVSAKSAGKILGAGARNASAAAKKKNPRLNRVSGASKASPIHRAMGAT